MNDIPGYDYASPRAAHSPLAMEELRALESAVGWTSSDAEVLRRATVLHHGAEVLVNSWRAEIARQPELARWFAGPDGNPDEAYQASVKRRFVQWVIDACTKPHDRAWLDYQEEIGLRHTPAKKNQTEGAHTPGLVPLRYVLGFTATVIAGVRPFLLRNGCSSVEIESIQNAWTKCVLLHATLWSRPYTRDGLW